MAQNKLTDSEVTIAAVLIITITAVILIGIFMLISLAVMSSWNLLSESAGWQMLIPVNFGTVTGSALILMFARWMTKRKGK